MGHIRADTRDAEPLEELVQPGLLDHGRHEGGNYRLIPLVKRLLPLAVALGLIAAGCGTDQPGTAPAEWSYTGDSGPAHWAELSPDYATCADGSEQSPIDLSVALSEAPAELELRYERSPAKVENNGHTIEVVPEHGGSIVLDGTEYGLAQFHLNSPSEHTLAGSALPLELHLVHKSAAGELAVLGVLLEPGSEQQALTEVLERAPAEEGAEVELERDVDAAALLPTDRTAFRYTGSLTTPPCSEGVRWTVFRTPGQVSQEQIDEYTAIYSGNARPVQPLDDRTVVVG